MKRKECDPEMSSTRKNNKWLFGAKGHIIRLENDIFPEIGSFVH